MSSNKIIWKLKQGESFERNVFAFENDGVTPIDLSGFTAKMQIRKNPDTPLVAEVLTEINVNVISVSVEKDVTANFPEGIVLFDLDIEKAGKVIPLVRQGKILVIKNINE